MIRRWLGLPLAVGILLGLASEWAGHLPRPWDSVALLGGPWVAAAFLVARRSRWSAMQIALATAVPAIGLIVNTIYLRVMGGSGSVRLLLSEEWPSWALLVLLGGILVGIAARLSRESNTAAAAAGWAIPTGLVLAEAAAIALGRHGTGAPVAAVNVVVVAALSFLAWPRVHRLVFLAAAAAIAVAGVALLPVVRAVTPVF